MLFNRKRIGNYLYYTINSLPEVMFFKKQARILKNFSDNGLSYLIKKKNFAIL